MAGTDAPRRRCTCPKVHASIPRRCRGAAGPTTIILMVAFCLADHPSSSAFVATPSRFLGASSPLATGAWRGPGPRGQEGMTLRGVNPNTRSTKGGGARTMVAVASKLPSSVRAAEMSGMTEIERAREALAAAKQRNLGASGRTSVPTAPTADRPASHRSLTTGGGRAGANAYAPAQETVWAPRPPMGPGLPCVQPCRYLGEVTGDRRAALRGGGCGQEP